jgi:hypothetical protein
MGRSSGHRNREHHHGEFLQHIFPPTSLCLPDNYLIDLKFIMDVEASRAMRQAEVGTAKTMREDGTFSREDFTFDRARDIYTCPAGKTLTTTREVVSSSSIFR